MNEISVVFLYTCLYFVVSQSFTIHVSFEVFPFVTQPVIGHGSSETSPFQHAKEAGLFYVEDADVNLASLASSKIVPDHVGQTTVKGT